MQIKFSKDLGGFKWKESLVLALNKGKKAFQSSNKLFTTNNVGPNTRKTIVKLYMFHIMKKKYHMAV